MANIGDWVLITKSHQIRQDLFDRTFPKGIFGRIIEINQFYSRITGKKRPKEIVIRAYMKSGRKHIKTNLKSLEKYNHGI